MLAQIIIVNECAWYTPSDPMWWLLGCWYLPAAFWPIVLMGVAGLVAFYRRRLAR